MLKKKSLSIRSPTTRKPGRPTGSRLFKNLTGHIIDAINEAGGSANAWQITLAIRKQSIKANDVTVRRYITDLVTQGHLKSKKEGRAIFYSVSNLDGKAGA